MKKSIINLGNKYLFWIGLCGVVLSLLPYLILGERAIIPYHDQLDGELLAYLFQAKYLFDGRGIIPEFLGGAAKSALIPPAPLAVLLFKVLPPFAAYVLLQAVGQVVAYVGMFRLAQVVSDRKGLALVAALLYAFLPFLPVYGLSQYGMPLLLLSISYLYQGERTGRSLAYVACYAALSSLVLCGFAWIGLWGVALVWTLFRKKRKVHWGFPLGFGVLCGVYLAENLTLLAQILGWGKDFVSHKSEYVLAGDDFVPTFWNYLLYNGEHSQDSHVLIACFVPVVLLAFVLLRKKVEQGVASKMKHLLMVLAMLVGLCLMAALWDCGAFVPVKERLGTLGTLQLDRVLWLAPMLWMLVLVFAGDILWDMEAKIKGAVKYILYGTFFMVLGCLGVLTLKESLVKPCVQKVLRPDYNAISYSDYLAVGVMEQVKEFIRQEQGMLPDEYKVASLGIDPAAALYHGFYCVDGYSNNYDLEYKHAFREVIAPELDKSEYLKGYFDDWGNRCYLYSSECPGYYTIEKGGFFFQNLELNTTALKGLGCDYMLSAAYIMNAEQTGLVLLREEAFETPDSYYRIFVYGLSE